MKIAVWFDGDLSRFRPGRLQQVGDHGPQLIRAAKDRLQVLALFRGQRARQSIEHERDKLMDAG